MNPFLIASRFGIYVQRCGSAVLITTERLTEEVGRVVLGWRLEMQAEHPAMRTQVVYRCVKPRR